MPYTAMINGQEAIPRIQAKTRAEAIATLCHNPPLEMLPFLWRRHRDAGWRIVKCNGPIEPLEMNNEWWIERVLRPTGAARTNWEKSHWMNDCVHGAWMSPNFDPKKPIKRSLRREKP